MNTTKDECDGWHTVSGGYPIPNQSVIAWTRTHGCVIATWKEKFWKHEDGGQSDVRNVTHWRELPEPPKSKDAFETWWEQLRINNHYSPDMARFVGIPEHQYTVMKRHAKAIWEAAINSTKQC